MPVYEYECSKCRRIEEIFQRITDPPIDKCSHCNGKMRKLISQSSFHLKGSGWYVTDYCSKSGGYDGKTSNTGKGSEDSKSPSVKTDAEKKAKPAGEKKAKEKD
ncbi:MAG: zinc ribbon domain-containing protein [Deltaproteobacteria bacterium]|nr:zinc ribbon domain-containing protein [Deltaproteobacteria bacterium]